MDIYGTKFVPNTRECVEIVDDFLQNAREEPIRNIAPKSLADRQFDAIFIGGRVGWPADLAAPSPGPRGRSRRPLIIDKWPSSAGPCPHEACMPHHVFSDCARQLDL